METINDRIKQVRKSLNLNQANFGEQITLAQTYLSQIERGDREVTEKILKLVCLQFNVSERWLRTGEGNMFEESSDSLISQLCEKYQLDDMAHVLLETFVSMPQNERDVMVMLAAMNESTAFCGPLIGISMGELGKVTRVRGGAFGSVMTFASKGKASAPGQIDAETLSKMLNEN